MTLETAETAHTSDLRTDAELTAAAQQGDTPAFEQLVLRHFDAVFMVAYARTGNREMGEDIAQEVFVRAYLNIAQLQRGSQFPAWVCRIARNLAIDWYRSPQSVSRLIPRLPDSVDVEQIPDLHRQGVREKMIKEEEKRAIRAAMLKLSPEHREVLLLHYCNGLNTTQIGEALGVHRTTIHYRLVSATREFRNQLPVGMFATAPAAMRSSQSARKRAAAAVAVVAALPLSEKTAMAMATADSTRLAANSLAEPAAESVSNTALTHLHMFAKKILIVGSTLAVIGIPTIYYGTHPRSGGSSNGTARVTIVANNAPMDQVARELGRQANVTIIPKGKTPGANINLDVRNRTLEDTLNALKGANPGWQWIKSPTQPNAYEIWDPEGWEANGGHCELGVAL